MKCDNQLRESYRFPEHCFVFSVKMKNGTVVKTKDKNHAMCSDCLHSLLDWYIPSVNDNEIQSIIIDSVGLNQSDKER